MTSRRDFLAAAGVAAAVPLFGPLWAQAAPQPSVTVARIRELIEGLSVFGRPEGGTFADGVSRIGYSEADLAGRQWVMERMRKAGLAVRIDAAGNIFGRRAGVSRDELPAILFGSHIDSVPSGGNFDGPLGSLGALAAMEALNTAGAVTRRPLEMVIWISEEGTAFEGGLDGSRAAAGRLREGELDRVWQGRGKRDAIRGAGGDPERMDAARLEPGSFLAYLELHIEQGGVLEQAGVPIGVVEGIVGIDWYEAVIQGFANHAGTTPMPGRRDALLAATYLIQAVNDIATGEPGRQVGTVGKLTVEPGAANVIPGRVRHTIEFRDLSREKMDRLGNAIKQRAQQIAQQTGTEITLAPLTRLEPAPATPAVQAAIEQAAAQRGLKSMRLPSGAGHDAQMMATLGPMGMIFVPSVGGVSHSPREFTQWEDCANGANVLLEAVLHLDRHGL
jgi:N-carbamoyl-L-amino-acid hydrolase